MTKYARGLHFHVAQTVLAPDVPMRIERLFNQETQPADYWETLMAAASYAKRGAVVSVGTHAEFQYSFNAVVTAGDAISVMVLEFYRSFPYVAVVFRPGTKLDEPVRLPF